MFLVERLQAVAVCQQGTDSLPDALSAHSPSSFIEKAVGQQVRALLCFYILKVQIRRARRATIFVRKHHPMVQPVATMCISVLKKTIF